MPDRKFAVLTDSASDIPYDMAEQSGIDILCFGITVDGSAYVDRQDFNFDQYYELLRTCQGVPSTAHIITPRFVEQFEAYDNAGLSDVLYVSINGAGSNTLDAAHMAREEFHKNRPHSSLRITLIDSHSYSMAYGWFLVEAVRKLDAGETMDEVAVWLRDVFTRVEIALAAFSLKFMKKSGRISAAAAIAGELLGVRPIISLNDGVSVVEKKVRGDKDVLPALIAHTEPRKNGEFYMVGGTSQTVMDELAEICTKKWNTPPVCTFKLGSAVASNTGPDAIALVFLGEARRAPDAAE